jgi:hypothetical protein
MQVNVDVLNTRARVSQAAKEAPPAPETAHVTLQTGI